MSKSSDRFSIRQVIDLTGLSEFTLRGWENRYQAFKPRRGSTGRRSYSQGDIQKALLLRELTLRDFRIGDIAQLANKDLERLLENKTEEIVYAPGRFHKEIESILKNLSLQNWDEIETGLRKALRSAKPMIALLEIIVPLVKELGDMVASGLVSISQEHILSAILKEQLYLLREGAPKRQNKKRFVVASPEGDFHELGILIAHTMLAHSGAKSLYLGSNTPKKELCETALRFNASHILLGSTVSKKEGAKEDLYSYIHFLTQNFPEDTEIWVGGRNVENRTGEIGRNVICFSSLTEFQKALS